MRDLSIIVAFSRDHSIIVVPNLPSSTIAQIELSMLDVILSFFAPSKAEDCTPQKCKSYFCSYKVCCIRV